MVLERSFIPGAANEKFTATRALSSVADHVDLADAQDDLTELGALLHELNAYHDNLKMRDAAEPADGWLATYLKHAVQILKTRQRRVSEQLESSRHTSDSTINEARHEYLAAKTAIRGIFRQRGTMLCQSDWQSPIYESTLDGRQNRLNAGIAEHSLDYKRDGHLDAEVYETSFVSSYANHLGSSNLRGYLTSCGMSAFSTILHWLVQERGMTKAFAVEPMYFENLHLAKATLPNLIQYKASGIPIVDALRLARPNLVFVDAVSNCNDVVVHDYETALRWACTEAKEPTAVVIDNTCLPAPLLQTELLANLPEHVTVILIESLAKYHQFGMDTVTAGIIVMHADEGSHVSLRKTRARLGSNIADTSVGSLPTPNRPLFVRRMQRHSRNTRMLANLIECALPSEDNAIEGVNWLRGGANSAPWFNGTCFTLKLKDEFRSVQKYQQFENEVMELAKQRKLPLALSTSFGFDVTRLYVTAPATVFEPPFLRISVGTEMSGQTETLAEILLTAGKTCKEAWDKENAFVIIEPAAEVAAGPITIIDRHNGVFAGTNAIKEYLSPVNFASPPLVELPADLNPFAADGVRLMAKMMPMVPLMNIKSVPAFSMLSRAAERGELDKVKTLIESSSSNTVLSLSVLGKLFGIDTTCAIVDHSIAPGLERMLRLFGIEIFHHPAAGHEMFGVLPPRSERAKTMGSQDGWMNPGQYDNPDNPEGFAAWLAPDLWNQTNGRLKILSCALGTCGTMVGVSRALRERNPNIEIVANCPSKGEAVPGPRERSLLADVAFEWQSVANAYYEIPSQDAFIGSVDLLRRGVLGGPSSGMNYIGALKYLQEKKDSGELSKRIADSGELWVSFLCCDSPLPHVDEYYDALGESFFPQINGVPAKS